MDPSNYRKAHKLIHWAVITTCDVIEVRAWAMRDYLLIRPILSENLEYRLSPGPGGPFSYTVQSQRLDLHRGPETWFDSPRATIEKQRCCMGPSWIRDTKRGRKSKGRIQLKTGQHTIAQKQQGTGEAWRRAEKRVKGSLSCRSRDWIVSFEKITSDWYGKLATLHDWFHGTTNRIQMRL